jgi:hypothetical protein
MAAKAAFADVNVPPRKFERCVGLYRFNPGDVRVNHDHREYFDDAAD